MTEIPEFNTDQLLILHLLKNPEQAYPSTSAEVGVTYERIMEVTGLTLEKTLLSLGWLEAKNLVFHDVAIERRVISYLGRADTVTHPGQRAIRLFLLTNVGREIVDRIPQIPANNK